MSNLKILFNDRNIYVKSRATFLLDLYSGAGVAFSLRKLKSTTVNVARVRRSSDNLEQDFRASQITDGTLTTFCGVGSGFVTSIYDQVGSTNMIQTLGSRQGILVNNGVLNTLNGKPVILKSVDNNGGYLSSFTPNGVGKSIFYVGFNGLRSSCIFGSNSGGGDYGYFSISGSTSTFVNNNPVLSSQKINGLAAIYSTSGDFYNLTTNQFLLSTNINFNFTDNSLSLGYRFNNPSNGGMFAFQEMIVWNNQLDTLAKENNINNNYTIY